MAPGKRKLQSDGSYGKNKKAKIQSYKNKRNKRKRCISDDDESTMELPSSISLEDDVKAGIIEKVTLKNFMCHMNLEFKFGPHTNLVTGRNGSGKSAVMNGIILGLGGRSYLTGRNANIKGFIQNDKQVANISVTLKNIGADAYRADEYGQRIIIERTITAEGTSKYKLKGDGGKLVTTKVEELTNILDALNIQVDNPVSFLTQEASRSFLQSKDPKKKYALFFKATLLQKLFEKYMETQQKINDSKLTLKSKNETLPEIEKEVKKWEEKLKKMKTLDSQEKKIKNLENELIWAIVMDTENRERCCHNEKEKLEKQIEKDTSSYKELERKYSNCLDAIKKQKDVCSTSQTELRTMKEEIDALAQKINVYNKALSGDKHHICKLKYELQQAENLIWCLEQTVNEMKQKSQMDSSELGKKREERRSALEMECGKLQYQVEQISDKITKTTRGIEELKSQIQIKKEEISSYQYKKQNKCDLLQTMISSRVDQTCLYGRYMPVLIDAIKAKSALFRKMPLGPIGMYLTVEEEKWIFAVEYCLRNVLSSFCCDNMEDKAVLQNIMREVYGHQKKPNIIVSAFLPKVHDVRNGKVVCDRYQTVLDAINCAEPIIMNCMIDQVGIESILLIEESSAASSLLMDSPPKNCSSAYTLIGDQVYPYPKYRYYGCRKKPRVQYLKKCYTADDIRLKESEIQSLDHRIAEGNQEIRSLHSTVMQKQQQVDQYNRQVIEHRKKIYDISQEIVDLNSFQNTSDTLHVQEEELTNKVLWREKLKKQIAREEKDYKFKLGELKKINASHDEKKDLMKFKQQKSDKLLDLIEGHQSDKVVLEEKKKKLLATIAANEEKLEAADKEWKAAAEDVEKNVQAASTVCARIDTDKSVAAIENEIQQIKNVLSEERMLLNREEVNKNYVEKKRKFDAIKKEIKHLENLSARMEKMIDDRWDKFEQLRTDTTLSIHYKFQTNLKARHYVGDLIFNHEEETLDISVNPRKTKADDMFKTNSLSGGERSYVTIALLLALCSEANMPFHILDEYDVFMDSIHKDMSMKIIMEMAARHNHQFIFLSPLSPPDVGDCAIIHKMPDPERSGDRRQDS